MERVRLTIEGMSCGHCVRAVDGALRSVPGVQVGTVEIGSVTVAYDPASVKPEEIQQAISEEGYTVRAIGRLP